jgi:hypothetical protein
MKKNYTNSKIISSAKLFALILFFTSATFKSYSQCTPRVLPFTEDFSGNPMGACNPTTGGWVATSVASGAGWWIPGPATNYAGGGAPEIEAYGDQANGGTVETISLTSPPINTTSVTTYTLSFKHNMYLHNLAASGSSIMSIDIQTSPDNVNWTSVYSNTYVVTSTLTSVVNETRTIPISGNVNSTTYVRFNVSGVLFKLWGWEIDDVDISTTTTSVDAVTNSEVSVFPNPVKDNLTVNTNSAKPSYLVIYDVAGKTIYQSQITSAQAIVDTKNFPKGIYFLQIRNETGLITRKIIKE